MGLIVSEIKLNILLCTNSQLICELTTSQAVDPLRLNRDFLVWGCKNYIGVCKSVGWGLIVRACSRVKKISYLALRPKGQRFESCLINSEVRFCSVYCTVMHEYKN
jgi:hypothetical protein